MASTATWKPWSGGEAINMPAYVYAFPRQQIDPLIDAICVRSALEHFHTISEVSDQDRREAFDNIKMAAAYFHVEVSGDTYEEMCIRPQVEVLLRD